MGSENEAEQSGGRPCRLADSQQVQADIRTHLIHRPARTSSATAWWSSKFPPIGFDPAWLSCCCGLFLGPLKLAAAVNPDAVQRSRPSGAPAPRSPSSSRGAWRPHGPRLEPRPLRHTHQHDMSRFVEHRPHHLVAAPRYLAPLRSDLARDCSAGVRPNTASTAWRVTAGR